MSMHAAFGGEEGVKHLGQVVWRNAVAVVADANDNLVIRLRAEFHANGEGARATIGEGMVEYIYQHPAQGFGECIRHQLDTQTSGYNQFQFITILLQ
jgi:hypothetical protein